MVLRWSDCVRNTAPGVTVIASLNAIAAALALWRKQHAGYTRPGE